MTTTATTPATVQSRTRPLLALAKAEYLQFRRNRTLMFMGTAFPIAIPLLPYVVGRRTGGSTPELAATALEMVAFITLVFVQYYSVLSMVTTRRGEGVLKRLRTGEAADWQIMSAPAVPGALLAFAGAGAVAVVVYATGAPMPVNALAMVLGLVGGLVVFALLALVTAAHTKNAEAAQITSLPVIALATAGLGSLRSVFPDNIAAVVDWTPFAAVSDLVSVGALGRPLAATDADVVDFAASFGELGRPVATLVAWTVLTLVVVQRSFRWDDRG
ncbi:ABC transporter permease [Mumia sp. zg.B53]|uniref:ABC transporter permease n=1 Tax=unclassified Mumia TaxID=2621872 RepID=UPI001C6EC103|nr:MULTISPECIES: ABC transporter permease [unclassified Mumia]MBW9208245.1 ABC transporter permease [Mumia sp. zg.B21]MBW9216201.1 ABC transporter permease [Mumia sp. zg.B53]